MNIYKNIFSILCLLAIGKGALGSDKDSYENDLYNNTSGQLIALRTVLDNVLKNTRLNASEDTRSLVTILAANSITYAYASQYTIDNTREKAQKQIMYNTAGSTIWYVGKLLTSIILKQIPAKQRESRFLKKCSALYNQFSALCNPELKVGNTRLSINLLNMAGETSTNYLLNKHVFKPMSMSHPYGLPVNFTITIN